jgi:hypothetical protein
MKGAKTKENFWTEWTYPQSYPQEQWTEKSLYTGLFQCSHVGNQLKTDYDRTER